MATLSTTASVLHELGLAAGFGGRLFGLVALDPAVAEIQSKRERGRVAHVAWDRAKMISGASLALMVGTWFVDRARGGGGATCRSSRRLTIMKDVLVGGALVSGIGSMIAGRMLDAEVATSNLPIEPGGRPYAQTRERVATLQKLSSNLGRLDTVINAAVLGVTAILAVKAARRWSFSRLLR